MENWKDGKMERWKDGKLERWSCGELESSASAEVMVDRVMENNLAPKSFGMR